MSIIPVSSCPSWCDPRAHLEHTPEDAEHRTVGLTWRPASADTEITVRTIRLDNTGPFGHTGTTLINLRIEHLDSVYLDDQPIVCEIELDPADMRMLAAALVCEADRAEQLKLRASR